MISIPASVSPLARRTGALVSAAAALLGFGFARPAVGVEDEPRLLAVQFDLAEPTPSDGLSGPLSASTAAEVAHYVGFQVDHGGVTRRLRPVSGTVTGSVATTAPAASVAVEIDGLRVGSAADDFTTTLTEVLNSPSVGQFVRLDAAGAGEPTTVEVQLPRPLATGDYLLIQEAGGDDIIEIEAIGPDGAVVGPVLSIGPPYRWNSGHRTGDGSSQWATVTPAPAPGSGGPSVERLRIRSNKAEMKVLVLEPAPASPDGLPMAGRIALTEQATATTPSASSPPAATQTPDTTPGTTPASTETPDTTPSQAPVEAPGTAAVVVIPAADHDHPEPVPSPSPVEEAVAASAPILVQGDTPAASPTVGAQTPDAPAPTALAMTGMPTEPWILVGLATGLIFFGYTAVAAFRRPAHRAGPGESQGHAQLDALGFD